jgi:dTDP-4-dehydrorhamnose reductase
MKSILVTGSNGQLGTALHNISGRFAGFKFHFTDIDTLDMLDRPAVGEAVESLRIDAVINCAAYTAVDRAEDDADACMRVNRDAVRNIGEAAASAGARVIHVSTDYVFDGKNTRPYREDDATNPSSVYGKSKLAGEQALLSACPGAVIIRTAWLYSETGNNFVRTMLRLGAERDAVNVVADQRGAPTYAADLAGAIMTVVTSGQFVPGIYHYSNEGICTWYDFAVKIFEHAGVKCRVHPVTTSEYPTRAARPAYSVLDKAKIRETWGVATPEWEDSLKKCLHNIPLPLNF